MDEPRSLEEYYIRRCLTLAARATRRISPNPRVGCVVLDAQGRKVSEGFHSECGGPHAEVVALERAGERARGGTLFVNLEPCAHHGKTPPCTERIIEAGIERVICGTLDPNPLVAGRGRDRLQNARISVRYGFLEDHCQALNDMFFQYIRSQRPFVTLKLAMTADGRIADRVCGAGARFTSPSSLQYVHHLRNDHDAILTTAQTVLADNPRLTVRDLPMQGLAQPWRVILDRRGRLSPTDFRAFDAEDDGSPPRAIVITTAACADGAYGEAMRDHGVDVLTIDEGDGGLDLRQAMARLSERGVASVITEAGGRLAARLLTQRLAHKLILFYAPQVLGDIYAPSGFMGGGGLLAALPQAPRLSVTRVRQLETDWVVEATPASSERGVNIVRSYGAAAEPLSPPIAPSGVLAADLPAMDAPPADDADDDPEPAVNTEAAPEACAPV